MFSITVNKHCAEQRLDRFLRKTFPDVYLSVIFSIIRKKKVRVNGVIGKASQILCENDCINIYENIVQKPTEVSFEQTKKTIANIKEKLNFVMLNTEFAVINKPSGLASQSGSQIREEESLTGMLSIWATKENLDFKPTLVHRLDKDTSGLIIAALSGFALREFGSIIRDRKIKKEYLALVKGHIEQKSGKIISPLPGDTKISESNWILEKSLGEYSLVRVSLKTGRKHQIRIHFAQIGHPVLGDNKHGDFALNKKIKKELGLSRLFLHATLLEFNWNGKTIKLEEALPKELAKVLERI